MKHKEMILLWLMLLIIALSPALFADSTPNPYSCVIYPEFANTDIGYDPLVAWATAGSNTTIDTLTIREIDVTDIEPIVCLVPNSSIIDTTSFVSAIPNDDLDDSACIKALINFLVHRELNLTEHIQIYIPPGVYNLCDQIIMSSNISIKGAGSHQTELRFLIRADSTSTTLSKIDCRKDAILVSGTDDNIIEKVGIEDLKIVRIREGLSPSEVKGKVGDYSSFNGTGYKGYWGNNIAIRRGTNCWIKGVESENTFRNHITLEYAHNNTISGFGSITQCSVIGIIGAMDQYIDSFTFDTGSM